MHKFAAFILLIKRISLTQHHRFFCRILRTQHIFNRLEFASEKWGYVKFVPSISSVQLRCGRHRFKRAVSFIIVIQAQYIGWVNKFEPKVKTFVD